MNSGLRHFANQFVAAWRSWMVIVVGAFAAGLVAVSVSLSTEPDSLDWGMFVVLLTQVGWVVALVGAGSANSTGTDKPAVGLLPRASLAARPNPTIPIHRITRVGAEALAGLAVLVAFQVVFLVLAFTVAGRAALPAMRVQSLGDVAALPMAAAWLLPAPSKYVYGLRGAAASLIGGVAVYKSVSMGSPVPALLVSMVLAFVLFATSDAVARVEGRSRRKAARAAHCALARRSRPPLQQLWRDALFGPFKSNRGPFYAAGGAALAALLLALVKGVPQLVNGGLILTATVFPGIGLMSRPLGLALGVESSMRQVGEISTGRWFAGGLVLPLRREWVARSFYLHGIVAGTLLAGLCLLNARLKGLSVIAAGITPSGVLIAWLPWPLMVPSFAGYLAASAMGGRRLRRLSLAALGLTWLTAVVGVTFHDPSASGNPTTWWADGAALLFALVGGVPPLVYLFPRRSTARRRV